MDHPLILRDFLSEVAVQYLSSWLKLNENQYNEHSGNGSEYWKSRCIAYDAISDTNLTSCLKSIMYVMRDIVASADPSEEVLYVEKPQFARWETGWELLPHADNIEQDGITPNATPWRSHGGVIYLNDDFEGGEIYYPNLGGYEVRPEPGMVVLHRAGIEHSHGIKKITKGTRHTISTFFTYQQHHAIL